MTIRRIGLGFVWKSSYLRDDDVSFSLIRGLLGFIESPTRY